MFECSNVVGVQNCVSLEDATPSPLNTSQILSSKDANHKNRLQPILGSRTKDCVCTSARLRQRRGTKGEDDVHVLGVCPSSGDHGNLHMRP